MSGRFTTLQSKGLKIDLWTIINDKIIKWHFKRRLKASMYDGFVKCHQSADARVFKSNFHLSDVFSHSIGLWSLGPETCGAVMLRLSLLHNFIQQNLNSDSAQVQILLEACRRFAMAKNSDNGPAGNKT